MSEVGATASWSGSGEGEQLWFLGTLATIRVPGEVTDGRFAVIEFLFPRYASPPLHTHPQDESYIVQEGRLTVQATNGSNSCRVRWPWYRWESRIPSAWTATLRECWC
jgi:quercetin dioxygenase-like cupin family protein